MSGVPMRPPSEDSYARRLEGGAALLAPARERYYRLVLALAESRWQERLRTELALIREVAAHQPALEAVLTPALRRAETEAWPTDNPTVRGLFEVHSLREQLARDVARKLGRGAREPLGQLLLALEDWLVTLPRVVPAHLRERTARELLPESLPALREASAFSGLLESLFGQPLLVSGRLPFSSTQREALSLGWARGEAALAALWRRLGGVDAQGLMVAELRKQARRAPTRPASTGPEHLLQAEYWYQEALARLSQMARVRLAPLVPEPAECLPVMWWLFEREYAPRVRLLPSPGLSDARAGLLEVAYELWDAQRPDLPEDERWTSARWARLAEQAERAEQARTGPAGNKLREALRALIQRHAAGKPAPGGWWASPDLVSLVQQARETVG